jgi:hypothetical protein
MARIKARGFPRVITMDEPNDVSIFSDDDDEVYACSNKHGTHKPLRIDLNPMAAKFWLSFPKSSSSGFVLHRHH